MKLNKFDRELILSKLQDLIDKKDSRINLKRNFETKDLEPSIINFNKVQDTPNISQTEIENARLRRESAIAMVNSCDIEIELIDNNIETLKKILINDEY